MADREIARSISVSFGKLEDAHAFYQKLYVSVCEAFQMMGKEYAETENGREALREMHSLDRVCKLLTEAMNLLTEQIYLKNGK